MRLEDHERRYLDICLTQRAENLSQAKLAERFEVSTNTVKSALKWGDENFVFEAEQSTRLEYHIQDMRAKIRSMEGELANALTANARYFEETGLTRDPKFWIPIMRMLHTYQMSLMELEGLYKKLVNVTVDNRKQAVFIIPEKSEGESWEETVAQFMQDHGTGNAYVDDEWEKELRQVGNETTH